MDINTLPEDPWFAPLHQRAAQAGFPEHTKTPEGLEGWFLDPDHLINHFYTQGIKLRWAYPAHAAEARAILDMSTDLINHCDQVLTPDHAFVGSLCTEQATFLLMTVSPSQADDRDFLSLAFCIPGDVLKSGFPALETHCYPAPWIAEDGMVDCMTIEDPNEGNNLLAIGTSGRGKDIQAIFKPDEANFELARTWHQKHGLQAQTPTAKTPNNKTSLRL